MAKNIRRIFAMIMVVAMFVSVLPMQTLAAETVHTTETSPENLTTDVYTTIDDEGNETVVVKITKGEYVDENGNVITVDREETIDMTGKKPLSSGEETKEWTEEDTGDEAGQPEVVVPITPGQPTQGTAGVDESAPVTNPDGSVTTTTTTDRTVDVETSEEKVTFITQGSNLEALQSELKYDPNDEADQKAKKKETDLYTDNGHFTDPDSIAVTDAPDDASFKFIGTGDYSGHYVSHILVIYERDEAGNPIKDENGEYVIKELQHASNGDVLTYGGVPTTNLNGPFDQATGTRPEQFLLKNENGDTVYGYCIDLNTGAEKNYWYQIGNLEDNDYYASEEAENHVRNIVTNGYWGTAEGTGSMDKIKEDLKAAVAAGTVDSEYDIQFVTRRKYKAGDELQEGEYLAVNKGTTYVCRQIEQHVVLTDEIIDAFTNGEALDATQSAIWSFANGSKYALDGTDRVIVGDITYASSAMGDSLNGENDFEGAARTLAFYNYLISLNAQLDSTVVINDKNNLEDINLVIGDKVEENENNKDSNQDNDVYHAELNFSLAFTPDPESDDLLVHITYVENGEPVTVTRRLAGENTEGRTHDTITPDENGVYVLSGLHLAENTEMTFDLRLEGTQYLENGVYVYTAQGGVNKSQTMVGMAEGTNSVDVSKSVTVQFNVDENNHVVAERKWSDDDKPGNTPIPEDPEEEEQDPPVIYRLDPDAEEEIPEEPVPLAAPVVTGSNSYLWILVVMMAVCSIVVINVSGKKNYAA